MHYHHITGRNGLSETVARLYDELNAEEDVFVFDFDRTLTNGFASPDNALPIEKRIRGGRATLEALQLLKNKNIPMYIVTARNPSRLTIEQLEASLQNCQVELGEIFLPPSQPMQLEEQDLSTDPREAAVHEYAVEKLENGMNLAYRGGLYASDYAKPNAISHLLARLENGGRRRVHFFDDFVGNAYDVGNTQFGSHEVHAYWWDSFTEESSGDMGLVSSFSSDFTYQPETLLARTKFGLNEEESKKRLEWVLQYEKDNNIAKPVGLEQIKPVVKKKDMSAFQNLVFAPRKLE